MMLKLCDHVHMYVCTLCTRKHAYYIRTYVHKYVSTYVCTYVCAYIAVKCIRIPCTEEKRNINAAYVSVTYDWSSSMIYVRASVFSPGHFRVVAHYAFILEGVAATTP